MAVSAPKLHHYVPQFHLRRFTDSTGKLWAWDRKGDRTFQATTGVIAAETHFYRLAQYEALGHDPMAMEKQLSTLEGEFAQITDQWLDWLRVMAPLDQIEIPPTNREIVSLYLALQHLRTADTREILASLVELDTGELPLPEEQRRLHTDLLWNEELVNGLASRFKESLWLFARNRTPTSFLTSDNPIAIRSADNRRWLRAGVTSPGTYAVFPMAPDLVLYCYPKEPPWERLAEFADRLSPIVLDTGMVESENTGQVFMASRFIFSDRDQFAAARAFATTIGSDVYAPPPQNRKDGTG